MSSESFFLETGLFADPADPLHFRIVHRAWYVVDLRTLLCQQLATLPWQPGFFAWQPFFRARFWLMDLLQKDSKGENSWLTFSSIIMAQENKTIGDITTNFQLHHDGRKGTTLDGSEILHQVVDSLSNYLFHMNSSTTLATCQRTRGPPVHLNDRVQSFQACAFLLQGSRLRISALEHLNSIQEPSIPEASLGLTKSAKTKTNPIGTHQGHVFLNPYSNFDWHVGRVWARVKLLKPSRIDKKYQHINFQTKTQGRWFLKYFFKRPPAFGEDSKPFCFFLNRVFGNGSHKQITSPFFST